MNNEKTMEKKLYALVSELKAKVKAFEKEEGVSVDTLINLVSVTNETNGVTEAAVAPWVKGNPTNIGQGLFSTLYEGGATGAAIIAVFMTVFDENTEAQERIYEMLKELDDEEQ